MSEGVTDRGDVWSESVASVDIRILYVTQISGADYQLNVHGLVLVFLSDTLQLFLSKKAVYSMHGLWTEAIP